MNKMRRRHSQIALLLLMLPAGLTASAALAASAVPEERARSTGNCAAGGCSAWPGYRAANWR